MKQTHQYSIKGTIKHAGIVTKKTSNAIFVSLYENIDCAGCQAKSSCGMSESQAKIVEIPADQHDYKLLEQVNLTMSYSLGVKAVLLAYLIPFLLLFSTLLVTSIFLAEWLAGLLAICILIPYYFILHYLNPYLRKTFSISLSKLT